MFSIASVGVVIDYPLQRYWERRELKIKGGEKRWR